MARELARRGRRRLQHPQDCNDADPRIHPGASDTPDDGIDQDCSGSDAHVSVTPPPSQSQPQPQPHRFHLTIQRRFAVNGKTIAVKRLKLTRLPAGARVAVRCRGTRCPVKSKKVTVPASGSVDVRKLLKGRPLHAGNRLKLEITAPGYVTHVVTVTARRGRQPKISG